MSSSTPNAVSPPQPSPFHAEDPAAPNLSSADQEVTPIPLQKSHVIVDKTDVQALLKNDIFTHLTQKRIDLRIEGQPVHVYTTIDPDLQNFIMENLDRKTSRYIGVVIMNARTGQVVSMVGYDSADDHNNPCVESLFPAASVFKIVTAAAVVEEFGMDSDSALTYSGSKYTLYRYQLEKESRRPVSTITLGESFARSVNPVFGKLGVHYLRKKHLENYAESFRFNQSIPFELPVKSSICTVSDDPYQWAEIASGFNRMTTLSPIHGAVMVSALVSSQGRPMEPFIVERITDEYGHTIYAGKPSLLAPAISTGGASVLKKLMQKTIETGTCRKAFNNCDEDPVLSRLNIGGKTGSIGSRLNEGRRFDWFVGFAEEKEGDESIVISIAVAHEKYIGMRANKYARMVIREYFRRYYAKQTSEFMAEKKSGNPPDSASQIKN
jgi:cell division protein FtsI/penicillin-binding protein 2